MSYQLVFWKRKPGEAGDPSTVYEELRHDRLVDGLMPFPLDDFLSKVTAAFPGARRGPNGSEEWVIWAGDSERRLSEATGMFEVTWSPQHVVIDARGLGRDDLNRLVDIGVAVGAPLYDPQTSERFDSWTDT